VSLNSDGAPQSNLEALRDQVTALAAALHALALEVKSEPAPAATQPAAKEVARV
jgi:hypothetical protein